ncbi:pyridoxamine 5'-phosphate oxidase family protein [Euzebya sp.]|uniref:pyridoxamine 5'-phosphate oxidase family protein n=1 Tax=Euzebya sp. TaxID=1971409 RepID=UPI0035122754
MEFVADPGALRSLYESPGPMTSDELPATRLAEDHVAFIGAATLVVVATADPGGLTCSPRGGAPGTVALVRDDRTLWLPDQGGRIHQTVGNLMNDPRIGLLFMAPAHERTLRVEGTARVAADDEARAPFALDGAGPSTVLVVDVHRVRLSGVGPLRRSGLLGDRIA